MGGGGGQAVSYVEPAASSMPWKVGKKVSHHSLNLVNNFYSDGGVENL